MQHQAAPLGLLKIAAMAVTVLVSMGAVAAGALPGINKPMPSFVLRVHRVLPLLTVRPIIGTLYLLPCGR
jgi:hypothetical protein